MFTTTKIAWQKSPDLLELNADQPDIWLIDLSITLTDGYLSDTEHSRLAMLSDPSLKARYRNSRLAMRDILSRYLHLPATEIRYRYQQKGKPELAMSQQPLFFNLSHCVELALFAVVKTVPIGIDIECTRNIQNYHSLARRIFSAADQRLLHNTASEQLAERFYQLWTAMEARQKAFGHGIFSDIIDPVQVSQWVFSANSNCTASLALALPNVAICPRFLRYNT